VAKKKKKLTELPMEKAIRKLLPKKVIEDLKKEAHRKDNLKAMKKG